MQPEDHEGDEDIEDPSEPETLFRWLSAERPVTLLDVRHTGEYEEWHIEGPGVESTNIPAYDFIEGDPDETLKSVPRGDPLVVVCAEGKSSALIAGWLSSRGYPAVNLAEGMNGWARVYVANEVSAYEGSGRLIQYYRPSSGCLGYMIRDGGEAAVFDPLRAFSDRYLKDAAAHEVTLKYALDTHIHADHVSGVRTLVDEGVEGVLPEPALERGLSYESEITSISDGEKVRVGSVTIEALHTPGHTSDMTAYHIDDSVLLTGDGLFSESVARPDLEEGHDGARAAARRLYQTLQDRILSLPDDTIIAGGHTSPAEQPTGDGTFTARLEELVERLAVLQLDESEFVERVLADMPPRPANYERIIAINRGRETADPAEAFELELGPNNCATSRGALS